MRILHIIGIVLFLFASPAAAKDAVAWIVAQKSGDVRVLRNGVQPASVQVHSALAPGDLVATGTTGRAMLTNGDDYVIVAPGSRLVLPKEQQQTGFTRLIQQVGTMLYKVKHTGVPHFSVETPMLAAVVKGTSFTIVVDQDRAAVQVTEGVVEVSSAVGEARRLVEGGMTVYIGRERPQEIIEMKPGVASLPASGRGDGSEAVQIESSGDVSVGTIANLTGGLVREATTAPVAPVSTALVTNIVNVTPAGDSAPRSDTAAPTTRSPLTDVLGTTVPTVTDPIIDVAETTVPTIADPVAAMVGTTVPTITDLVVGIVNAVPPTVTGPVVGIVDAVLPTVTDPVVGVADAVVPTVTDPVVGIVDAVVPTVTQPVVDIVQTVVPTVTEPVVGIVETIAPTVTQPVVDIVETIVPTVTEPVVGIVDAVVPTVTQPVVDIVQTVVPTVTEPVVGIVETIVPTVTQPVVDTVETIVPTVTEPVVDIVETTVPAVTQPVVEVVEAVVPAVTQPVGGLLGGILRLGKGP